MPDRALVALVHDLALLLEEWNQIQERIKTRPLASCVFQEPDLIERTVRDFLTEDVERIVVDSPKACDRMREMISKISKRSAGKVKLYTDPQPIFDRFNITRQLENAFSRQVHLKGGGYIVIDETEALVAIDVNTGSYVGRKNLEDTVVRTNLEAAAEAVRQLRLRDIGGIIVIDFIDMETPSNRQLVMTRLLEALERDRTKTRISEMSRLGLVELTRKNVTDGLYGVLTEPCPCCGGEGRVLSEATRRITVERRLREILLAGRSPAYLIGMNPETYALIIAPGHNALALLRTETGKRVSIIPDPDVGPTDVQVLIEGKAGALGMDAE